MRKLLIGFFILLALLATGAFFAYQYYLPKLAAAAVVEEGTLSYLPESVKNKIGQFREPVNRSADKIIREMHRDAIPLSTVLREIDHVSATDLENAANEISRSNPKNTNEVFNILKRNINTNLDIEPLRQSFIENTTMEMINNAVAEHHRMDLSDKANFELFKNISKEILIRKEQVYMQNQKQSKTN